MFLSDAPHNESKTGSMSVFLSQVASHIGDTRISSVLLLVLHPHEDFQTILESL